MTSTTRAQASHVVHVLNSFASALNPVTAIRRARSGGQMTTVLPATHPSQDSDFLPAAQASRVEIRKARLPAAARGRLADLLAHGASEEERSYLLKAFAAGHPLEGIASFAAVIHGRPCRWLRTRLSLIEPTRPGSVTYDGFPVRQVDPTTCGSASILMTRAILDPLYACRLTTGGEPDTGAERGAAFYARLTAEQSRIHDATNLVWPQRAGTTPWGVATELNRHAHAWGIRYDWRVVDDTSLRSVTTALRDLIAAADRGLPVPILLGNMVPRHYVLLVARDGDDLLCYEPTNAKVVRVGREEFTDGRLGKLGPAHAQAVVVPREEPEA